MMLVIFEFYNLMKQGIIALVILLSFSLVSTQNCSDFNSTNSTNSSSYCVCAVDYCDRCVLDNTDQCHDCHDGFNLIQQTKQCEVSQTCQGQLQYDGSGCSCPVGFYANDDQDQCLQCSSDQCADCTEDGCNICTATYYKNNQNQCQSCTSYCKQCTTNSDCSTCIDGFYYVSGIQLCQQLPAQVSSTFSDGSDIGICMGGCKSCSSANNCISCSSGFYLIEYDSANSLFECQTCDPSCKTCQNQYYCLSCYNGFYLQGYSCQACPSNCLSCPAGGYCAKCERGYYLNNGRCSPCSENCQKCFSASKCTQCTVGFAVVNNECTQCFPGCGKCNSADIAQCLSCVDRYYQNSNSCISCPTGCSKCSSATFCSKCDIGYRLRNNRCYSNCRFPCLDCQNGQPSNCTACYLGYNLNDDQCEPQTCSSGCQACPLGYYLNGDACQECQIGTISHCNSCSNNNRTKCTSCQQGFALQQDICSSCSTGCERCESVGFCLECKDGYFMGLINNEATGTCEVCSSEEFCKTCSSTANQCTSCLSNYTLVGRKCKSNKYILCNMEFDTEYSDFSPKINLIKQGLTNILGSQYKDRQELLTMYSLKSGSVLTQIGVTIRSGTDQQEVYNNLNDGLTKGAKLGGVALLQAVTLQTQNFQPVSQTQQQTTTPNLAVILGVSIPLGIIVLVLIFLVIKSNREDNYKDSSQQKTTGSQIDNIIDNKQRQNPSNQQMFEKEPAYIQQNQINLF